MQLVNKFTCKNSVAKRSAKEWALLDFAAITGSRILSPLWGSAAGSLHAIFFLTNLVWR
jgi:hypothetical protein